MTAPSKADSGDLLRPAVLDFAGIAAPEFRSICRTQAGQAKYGGTKKTLRTSFLRALAGEMPAAEIEWMLASRLFLTRRFELRYGLFS